MSLWAEAVVVVPEPRKVNIKNIVIEALKIFGGQEVIVDSTYSKDSGVLIGIRTDYYLGSDFNTLLTRVEKSLKKEFIGHFYIEVTRNWYNL